MAITMIEDSMHYVKQNTRFMYLKCAEMSITVRKKDMHVYLEEPPDRYRYYHFESGSVSICNLDTGIRFLQRIKYLYNLYAPQ